MYKSAYPLSYGLNCINAVFFYKDEFGIEQPTKVDMLLNQKKKTPTNQCIKASILVGKRLIKNFGFYWVLNILW